MMIALSRTSKSDPLVLKIKQSILPFFGRGRNEIQKAVAYLMKQTDVIDIDDEDVLDCTVLAELNGRTSTIHMFESGHHASRFPLEVQVDSEGHPGNEDTCDAMIAILRDNVIAVTEDD